MYFKLNMKGRHRRREISCLCFPWQPGTQRKYVTDQEHKNPRQGSGMDPALPDPTSTLHYICPPLPAIKNRGCAKKELQHHTLPSKPSNTVCAVCCLDKAHSPEYFLTFPLIDNDLQHKVSPCWRSSVFCDMQSDLPTPCCQPEPHHCSYFMQDRKDACEAPFKGHCFQTKPSM